MGGLLLIRAVAYIRVSTEEQADSRLSLEHQTEQLQSYAGFRELDLVEVIADEALSGGKPLHLRPGGAELFDRIETGEVTAVIACRLDRMFRNALDCLQVHYVFQEKGVTFHLLDLNVDTGTAMGKAFLTIAAAFAELELNRGKERTRDALAALKRRGSRLGGVPYGYGQEAVGDLRAFPRSQSEQQAIDLMVRCRAAGLTYAQIAACLSEAGIPTKRGKTTWQRATVRRIILREERREHENYDSGSRDSPREELPDET